VAGTANLDSKGSSGSNARARLNKFASELSKMVAEPTKLAILSEQMGSYRLEVAKITHVSAMIGQSSTLYDQIFELVHDAACDLIKLGSRESKSLIVYANTSHVYTILFVEMVNLLAAAFRSVGIDSQGGSPILSISQANTILKTLRLITIQLFNGASTCCQCNFIILLNVVLYSAGVSQVAPEILSTMQALNRLGTILIFPWRLNLDPRFLSLVEMEFNNLRCNKQALLAQPRSFFAVGSAYRESDANRLQELCRPRNVPLSVMLQMAFKPILGEEPFGCFALVAPICFSVQNRDRQWLQLVLRCGSCQCYTFIQSLVRPGQRLCVYCLYDLQVRASADQPYRYWVFFFLF